MSDIKFEQRSDFNAHDALLCIAQKSTINQTNRKYSNSELFLEYE